MASGQRRKLSMGVLWLLEGPVWWAGPALIVGGTILAALVAGQPLSSVVFIGLFALLAALLMGLRPLMGTGLILFIAVYIVYARRFDSFEFAWLGAVALGTFWMIFRRMQFEHYRKVAQQDLSLCPVCGYDYAKTGDVCPECGTNVPEYMERVRKAVK